MAGSGLASVGRADLAWMAGLYEGEGSISAILVSPRSCHLQIKVMMTDEDVLRRLERVSGLGKVYGPYWRSRSTPGKSLKPIWVWIAYSLDAYAVAVAIFPRMLARRQDQIRVAVRRWLGAFHARPTPSDRFWAFVDMSANCWLWKGSLASNVRDGQRIYGQFAVAHERTMLAHRFAYADVTGPLAAFEQLYSSCETPLCVRPDHWYSTRRFCKFGHERAVHGVKRSTEGGRWRCKECVRLRSAGVTLGKGRNGR